MTSIAKVDLSGDRPSVKLPGQDTKSNDPRYENILTIFTDLSLDPKSTATGAGFWMRTKDKKLAAGSELKLEHHHTAYGETLAAVIGVEIAKDKGLLNEATYVVIVLDNLHAVNLLNRMRPAKERWERDLLRALEELLKPFNLQYKVNKVKAHVGTSTPRNWVNNKVDELAKHHMRNARKRKEIEENDDDTVPF